MLCIKRKTCLILFHPLMKVSKHKKAMEYSWCNLHRGQKMCSHFSFHTPGGMLSIIFPLYNHVKYLNFLKGLHFYFFWDKTKISAYIRRDEISFHFGFGGSLLTHERFQPSKEKSFTFLYCKQVPTCEFTTNLVNQTSKYNLIYPVNLAVLTTSNRSIILVLTIVFGRKTERQKKKEDFL